jgi:hypothetical protein
MDAGGLAVGIVALITSFKACIDLFSYFTVAKSLGRDYELLSAKLEVEKTLLLQWAHRTNLLRPNYDRRLDDPAVRSAVARVIAGIQVLLGDTQTLQQRYGVQESQPGEQVKNNVCRVGANRMSAFARDFGKLDQLLKEFEDLNLHIRAHQASSCTLKVRWAIRDKDQFSGLLQELSYFVSRLHDLIPESPGVIQAMAEEDIQRLSNWTTVRLLTEAASGRNDVISDISGQHQVKTCEERILRRLWFRLMDDRRNSLSPPNPKTFEWAIEATDPDVEWNSVSNWLLHGSGIYWVCGKGDFERSSPDMLYHS